MTLNPQQQRRAEVLARLTIGALSNRDGAELLGVSERQARRLCTRYQQEGLACLVHGNVGRRPINRTVEGIIERVRGLVGEGGKYHDLNVCHLQELLERSEGISLGRSTLDRLLKREGVRVGQRESPGPKRRRRERQGAEGMLVQVDGSPHDWLEERGPRLALMGAIDDATGKPVYLRFEPSEDQAGYLRLFQTLALTHGLPLAVYHDRHTILRSPKAPTLDDELAGRRPMSQVQRVLDELGIEAIAARSPQAKGRIERLWGTLQDRLTKELRLAEIATREEANAFLPEFTDRYVVRFARAPTDPKLAWRPLSASVDLAYHFAVKETRKVRADHCLAWHGKTLQIAVDRHTPNLAGATVSVHVDPDGAVFVYHGTIRLSYQEVAEGRREQAHALAPSSPRPAGARGAPAAASNGQRRWLFART